ncbi:coproporphyrinogen dehydrogenase HemZ [Clostridiisalibacter paucivorans]|uniref:coproporphyrinogen dehydrogenase HemZ n=1 Tax=Clostridiisalibacter paucivorans TaxID=408753 RepID=UPI00047D0681|nr:coproporphyrinogen dehydrogenase HemZ [Clostridiisalibacter paucivorans]
MIYLFLDGHELAHELRELIKVFYKNKKIEIVDERALVYDQGLYIESKLLNNNGTYSVYTKIYENNTIIAKDFIDDVDNITIHEDDFNKIIRVAIKKSLYKTMCKINNKKAPWGILTGIRPVKIVHKLMDLSIDERYIYETLTDEYMISKDKAYLILDIAKRERRFLYPLNNKKFSLYLSIPFCPGRCVYCSFPSNDIRKRGHLVNKYIDSIIYEIKSMGKVLKDYDIQTVYIGGGTPTSIPKEKLINIIDAIYDSFDGDSIREFTVEAGRPDTISEDMLLSLKEKNVGRISINPQTMCDETLKIIGRRHNSEDIIKSFEMARKVGFDFINMDMILGLPGEGLKEVEYTLKCIEKLRPENLTVHTLAIKRASKLKGKEKEYAFDSENQTSMMLQISKKYTKLMGLYPYYLYRQKNILGNLENIGYTQKGKECIYNMAIMEERQTIMALGAGAVSKVYDGNKDRLHRVPNVKDIIEYISRIEEMIDRKKNALQKY